MDNVLPQDAKNFGHRRKKRNDVRFRALFAAMFSAKMHNGRSLLKKLRKMISLWGVWKGRSTMTDAVVNSKQLTDKELEEHQRQQMEQQERIRQRAEALVRRIGETCDELERLAVENPELVGRVSVGAEEHKDAYLRLKARLELADTAPRCRWVRTDGTSCGSPQMKKHIYCFAHRQMMEARALALSLPALEDANAIQVGLMRIQKALIDDTISTKKAGLLLYSMQLALQNVGQVMFGQVKTQELVRETVSEDAALSENQTPTTETLRHEKEKSLPRINADERGPEEEENEGLPLMNADDTDTEKGLSGMNPDERELGMTRKPVEWRPSAEVFRIDTREGIEAYEASFRMKIRTWLDRAGTPPRAAVPHE